MSSVLLEGDYCATVAASYQGVSRPPEHLEAPRNRCLMVARTAQLASNPKLQEVNDQEDQWTLEGRCSYGLHRIPCLLMSSHCSLGCSLASIMHWNNENVRAEKLNDSDCTV